MRRAVLLGAGLELTAGSTWHAAGLCTQFAPSLRLMRLLRREPRSLRRAGGTHGPASGVAPLWVGPPGGIRAPSRPVPTRQRDRRPGRCANADHRPRGRGAALPVDGHRRVLAAAYLPTDGHVDPSGATNALATGAVEKGARIYRHAKVEALRHERRGWSVETTRGRVHADAVVNAAGQWARQVGRLAGAELPVVPLEHHYVVTEPIAEARRTEARTPCPARCGGLLLRASGG